MLFRNSIAPNVLRFCLLVLFNCVGPAIVADQMQPTGPFAVGYTDKTSYASGEDISFHLSSSAPKISVKISRLGPTNKEVYEKNDVAVATHPIPDRASSHGCNWPSAFKLTVPEDWKSGYYQAQLIIDPQTKPSTLFFIVRAKQSKSKILIQLSTNTYNAYTNWGGHSLYAFHDRDGVQGHRVSFNRPQSSQFENWEGPFIRWAESNGFVLDYAANSDLEFHPEILRSVSSNLNFGIGLSRSD